MEEKIQLRQQIALCSDADGRDQVPPEEVPTLEKILDALGGEENVYSA